MPTIRNLKHIAWVIPETKKVLLKLEKYHPVLKKRRKILGNSFVIIDNKSQHGCVRWALREHLTPPCSDFACGGLEDYHQTNIKYFNNFNM